MSVSKVEIKSRRPVGTGQKFGVTGQYEHVEGTASFAIDPNHPLNRCVTDIDLAPLGSDGMVHFLLRRSLF